MTANEPPSNKGPAKKPVGWGRVFRIAGMVAGGLIFAFQFYNALPVSKARNDDSSSTTDGTSMAAGMYPVKTSPNLDCTGPLLWLDNHRMQCSGRTVQQKLRS
jgi:hypothetical protein